MSEKDVRRFRRAPECVIGTPATDGNAVDRLRNGDQIFPAMLDAIASTEHTVDFTTFVYWQATIGEEFATALAERARAGVRVRVLLDAMGAVTIGEHLIDEMKDAGADVEWFRPLDKAPALGQQPSWPPQDPCRRRTGGVHGWGRRRRRVAGRRPLAVGVA